MAQSDHPSWIDPGFEAWIGKKHAGHVDRGIRLLGRFAPMRGPASTSTSFPPPDVRQRRGGVLGFQRLLAGDARVGDRGLFFPPGAILFRGAPRLQRDQRCRRVRGRGGGRLWRVNDGDQPCAARLRYGLFELAGQYPLDQTADVTLLPNASTRLASFPKSKWTNPNNSGAFAVLTRGMPGARSQPAACFSRGSRICSGPRQKSHGAHGARPRGSSRARRSSGAFALDLNGEELLPDNFFDVYPGQPHTIVNGHAKNRRVSCGSGISSVRAFTLAGCHGTAVLRSAVLFERGQKTRHC